nr:hypothetical protein [Streptomyces aurantiacus]
MNTPVVPSERSFASRSVPAHLVRGIIGFGLLAGSVALVPVVGLFGLLLAPGGAVALRGCPACWAIGLAQTISRGRLSRACADDRCRPTLRHARPPLSSAAASQEKPLTPRCRS